MSAVTRASTVVKAPRSNSTRMMGQDAMNKATAAGTVNRLAAAVRSPAVAAPDGIVCRSGGNSVVSMSATGDVRWTHAFPLQPAVLLAGADGHVVVVGEPDRERRRHRADTTLWCLAPDGTPAWTWQPPGPLTGTPILNGDVLYVVADGRLFGLSLAGYNVLISLLLAAVAAWGALARRNQGSSSVSQ